MFIQILIDANWLTTGRRAGAELGLQTARYAGWYTVVVASSRELGLDVLSCGVFRELSKVLKLRA